MVISDPFQNTAPVKGTEEGAGHMLSQVGCATGSGLPPSCLREVLIAVMSSWMLFPEPRIKWAGVEGEMLGAQESLCFQQRPIWVVITVPMT